MINLLKSPFCELMPVFIFHLIRVLMVKQVPEVSKVHLVLKEMKEQEDFLVLQALLGYRYQTKYQDHTHSEISYRSAMTVILNLGIARLSRREG